MIFNRHAKVHMEEGYMRLSVEYTNPKSRLIICEVLSNLEKKMDLHPEVIHRRVGEESGSFSIEFDGDNYLAPREAGKFIDSVLEELEIDKCDYLD